MAQNVELRNAIDLTVYTDVAAFGRMIIAYFMNRSQRSGGRHINPGRVFRMGGVCLLKKCKLYEWRTNLLLIPALNTFFNCIDNV